MRHRPQAHACRQRREKTFDNASAQFHRAFTLAVRPHRSIPVPQNSHRPSRRHVFHAATGNPAVAHTTDHQFRHRDVLPFQFLANIFSLRLTKALANFALECFEPAFMPAPRMSTLVHELQQPLQNLPAIPRNRLLVTDFRYNSHGPISGGYPSTRHPPFSTGRPTSIIAIHQIRFHPPACVRNRLFLLSGVDLHPNGWQGRWAGFASRLWPQRRDTSGW